MRYQKPVYSKEQYERWDEAEQKRANFLRRNTKETEKKYFVNDCIIVCKSIKYSDYLKNKEGRQDSYIITVYEGSEDMEHILAHRVCRNPEEANEQFLILKAAC